MPFCIGSGREAFGERPAVNTSHREVQRGWHERPFQQNVADSFVGGNATQSNATAATFQVPVEGGDANNYDPRRGRTRMGFGTDDFIRTVNLQSKTET